MPAGLSVVIPNYNGRSLLAQNLPSVEAAIKSWPFSNVEIIVSDDASTDDSIAFLESHYQEVQVVKSSVNTGFSGAVNRGIAVCKEEFVLLLNSDITLTPDYFSPQMPWFDNPEIFGIMSKICSPDGLKTLDAAKFPGYRWGNLNSTLNYESEEGEACPTLFLSGANALVRRTYLEKLQGFDEVFNPYYCEDVDLGIRAWRAGWICLYEPGAICFHPVSATIGKVKSETVKRISRRNKAALHLIHVAGISRVLYCANLFLKTRFSWLPFLKKYRYLKADLKQIESLILSSRDRIEERAHYPKSLSRIIREIKNKMPGRYRAF